MGWPQALSGRQAGSSEGAVDVRWGSEAGGLEPGRGAEGPEARGPRQLEAEDWRLGGQEALGTGGGVLWGPGDWRPLGTEPAGYWRPGDRRLGDQRPGLGGS